MMQSELVPEICRAHRDEQCKQCDETSDELWVHPQDALVGCTKDPECEAAGGLCENVRECGNVYPTDSSERTDMDIDDLAQRLKDGFRETVQNSDNGENGPLSDPRFWQNYARWWDVNGKW